LYSSESLQSNVKENEFNTGYLSNGEKIIVFNRTSLKHFFDNIYNLFKEYKESNESSISEIVNEPITEFGTDILFELSDKSLIQEIKPLLKKNKVLEAVEICSKYYKGRYKKMTFKDWFKLVNQLYKKIIDQS